MLAWRRLGSWLWIVGLTALPLMIDPLRLEAYETPRATLSIVLALGIILSALAVWSRLAPLDKRACLRHPLTIAIALWAVSITLSAVLSLAPLRSILGDTDRRMGAITQLSFLAAVVGSIMLSRRERGRCWPVLAVVGALVAAYGILQWVEVSRIRPATLSGNAELGASWAIIVILWIGVAFAAQITSRRGLNRPSRLYAGSLAVLVIFLLISQTRSAIIGLAVGLVILGVTWTITHGRKRLGIVILTAAGVAFALGFGLYSGVLPINWSTSFLRNIPLIQRLDPGSDQSGKFRLLLWQNVGHIVANGPVMIANNGQTDQASGLRPLVGYGQEMFQIIESRFISDDLRATYASYQYIDRAHNLWLDTLVTQGILGVISLLTVYVAAAWTSIHVLRQQRGAWDERGWIAAAALAILTAHVIDLQFSFPSVASEWPFWAAIGLLMGASLRVPVQTTEPIIGTWLWPEAGVVWRRTPLLTLLTWVLACSLAVQTSANHIAAGSILLILGLLLVVRGTLNRLLTAGVAGVALLVQQTVAGSLVTALSNAQADQVVGILLADHTIVLIGLVGLTIISQRWFVRRLLYPSRRVILPVFLMMVVCIWWVLDATADSIFLAAGSQKAQNQVQLYRSALTFKTPDDRLAGMSGQVMLSYLSSIQGNTHADGFASACNLIEHAEIIDPYDPSTLPQALTCADHLPKGND